LDLNTKVEVSIRLIRGFAERFGGVYVGFSGGKDSAATLLLALEALPPKMVRGVVFIEVTGNTHELNTWYVYDLADRLGVSDRLIHLRREDIDFFTALARWGLPHRVNRWCWNEFKMRVFKGVSPPVFLVGVKHSDSRLRELSDWSSHKVIHGMIVFSPIYAWTTDDVRDYLRSRNVDLCPCYGIYGHSGNCMFCPFRSREEIRRTVADPVWGPRILSALSQLRNEWGRREYRRWARYASRSLLEFAGGGGR